MNKPSLKIISRSLAQLGAALVRSMSFCAPSARRHSFSRSPLAVVKAGVSVLWAALLLVACGDDGSLDTSGLFTYEEAQPVVTISGPSFTNANVSSTSLQYTILIDQPVENELSATDPNAISVTNGSVAALSRVDAVNLDEYILYVQPDPLSTAEEIVITVLAGAVSARIGEGSFPNEAASFVVEYDNTGPVVDITVDASVGNAFLEEEGAADVSNDDYYVVNDDFSVLFRFDEQVSGLTAEDIELSVAGVNVADTLALNGGLSYRVDFELDDSNTLADNTDIVLVLSAGAVEDLSGALTEEALSASGISDYTAVDGYANERAEYLVTLDRSAPTGLVASVPEALDYSRSADFALEGLELTESIVPLKPGDRLEFVVEFSETVTVSGTPYIPFGIDSLLNDDNSIELEKKALFSFLGENSLGVANAAATFIYTVEASSNLYDTDGINAVLNSEVPQVVFPDGAFISDKYENAITQDIDLSPAFSLSDLTVDTIIPTITDITWAAEGHVYNSESESGKFSVDEIITFNLSFSEVVYPNSFSESVSDYSFSFNLKSGNDVTPIALPGTRHIVEDDISVLQFEFLIEDGYNASDGLSYVDFYGPLELYADKAGNNISQSLESLVSRTTEEINIFIDAELPELLSINEISVPAESSSTEKDLDVHYYVGANYKADDAEIIELHLNFTEEVMLSTIDATADGAVNLIAYFKDNSDPESVDNTYSFTFTGAYDELNATLPFAYEVVPFGEVGVTSDDLDGIELDYLLLENVSIQDDFGNSIHLDSSDDINLVYRASVRSSDVSLDFLENIRIATTPAEITGISFTGVDNGAEMLTILGEGSTVEVVLTFDQLVQFYYNLSGGNSAKPSLALEIVAGTEPNLNSTNVVYAHYSAPGLDIVSDVHSFTYTIQAEDANRTESSIWLLRNSDLADNGGYDDLMVVTGSRVFDQRGRDVQEGFSSEVIKDDIFADGYARHPLIPLETGVEPIAYFNRPAGYDTSAGVNDYIIYPEGEDSVSFTLAYGGSANDIAFVQVLIEDGGLASNLPYLLLYGDLIDSDAGEDSERWEARAYLSLGASGLQSAVDSTYSDLVFILSESDDPADDFAAQYSSADSVGLIYDSLVVGADYSIATPEGNPVQTDLSNYTYDNNSSLTLSTARERVFYDPNPRIVAIVEQETDDSDKSYNLGETIKVAVSVSEDVEVVGSGAVRLHLLGEVVDIDLAGYYSSSLIELDYLSSESTERELVFGYEVGKDKYADSVSLDNLGGMRYIETTGSALIRDTSAAARELRGFSEGLTLAYDSDVVSSVDSRAPRIDSISVSRIDNSRVSTPLDGSDTVTFVAGDQIVFTLTFHSELVLGSPERTSIFGSPYVRSVGAPRLRLEIDPELGYTETSSTRYAEYDTHVTGSGSSLTERSGFYTEHQFIYTITAEDHDSSGIKLVGPLDSSEGLFENIPEVSIAEDKNEANYSLYDALVDMGMAADSAVEEYELDYLVVDNYPTLVDFHIDTTESTTHTTSDLAFTPIGYSNIQFYAIINQADVDEGTANTTVTLPFTIYDSLTGDSEDFAASYVDWRSSDGAGSDAITITGIEGNYSVSASNYSVFLFTYNIAAAPRARNVNANTIIIPENPFQGQTFNPKNSDGIAVNLLIGETNISSLPISEVDQLVVDYRPPEIVDIELPASGLYHYSTSAVSTQSDLTYTVTFSEAVYAPNLNQADGAPRFHQQIGSDTEIFASCITAECLAATGVLPTQFSTISDHTAQFSYAVEPNTSGYVSSFYVVGGPDADDVTNIRINTITDAYGNELLGYTIPEFSTDGRDLSLANSIDIYIDNEELAIEAVNLPPAGIYQDGAELNVTVEFSREIQLERSNAHPQIVFLVGDQDSNYADGNKSIAFEAPYNQISQTLTFTYEVEESLGRDDYDGIQFDPAVIDWQGAIVRDTLRPTEDINTSSVAMTELSSFIAGDVAAGDVVAGVNIDVVYPELEISALQLGANPDNAADGFADNDYQYYLNSHLIFSLSFNEPVVIPFSGAEYQSFIKFAYADSNGTDYERSVRFDPEYASTTLTQYGQSWDYNSGSNEIIYFVYEVGADDATSAADDKGFIADGYLRLRDINLSSVVDRAGKPLLLNSQLSITPNTAVIDLDKTSIYAYNLFAVDDSNTSFELYSSDADAGDAGLLTKERYITSGQDLVVEFSFRHHPNEDPSQVIFDLGSTIGLTLDIDIDNERNDKFSATLQEDSSITNKSYSNGTSTLRYLLDLSSYTATTALSDLDGIGIAFPDADLDYYKDQSGPVNLAFADIFLSSLELVNVDTQGPEIDDVYMQASDTGLTLYYGDKDELQLTVQFSEPVTMTSGTFGDVLLNFHLYDVEGAVASDRNASFIGDDGNVSYTFAYAVDQSTDADFEQIYLDTVELVHSDAAISDITSVIGDTRDDPNPLVSATYVNPSSLPAVSFHAIDFDDPNIASLIIPSSGVSAQSLNLGGGDELALTLVTSREVAFASDSSPRLRLLADSTPITFHYAGDYNSSAFAISHTFTYVVGANIETNSSGLYLPADALHIENSGALDAGNNPLNPDLDISVGSTQFDTGSSSWSANPTDYIFIDSRIPEFADKYIPPQYLTLEYENTAAGIEFNSSHIFTLDTVSGSGFLDEFGAGFVAGTESTAVDFTRPVYQSLIEGTRWYIWSSTADGYYRISTSDAYNTAWLFSKASDVASIQDVFFPSTIFDFGELRSNGNTWYLVDNLVSGTLEFNPSSYGSGSEVAIDATLNQRYLIDQVLHTYLVLSEPVQVADDFASSFGNYPAYSLTYTNSYDGSNSATDLPLTFSHWIQARPDADTAYNNQVMVYTNTLNSSTTNRANTAVQPSRQLAEGAQLEIRDLFGNALPLADDNSSLNVYQDADNNNLSGVQLSGYLVQLDSVSLYHLPSATSDQVDAIAPDFTYIIGDQLVLDLTFNAELRENTYAPAEDLLLTIAFNDASSKEHVLGDGVPSAGAGVAAGDHDLRYWYNSESNDYDDNLTRSEYEAEINSTSSNFNNVLRYIFTISDRADGDDFNTLEEGVGEPNLSISGLSFNSGLVDEYGSRVDEDAVLAALRSVVIPITIDSIRPQIHLSSNASDGGDYYELAEFTTYSRDDYFANLNGNVAQYPREITFTLAFTEPIVMPAKSSVTVSGESDFSSGLRFYLTESNGSVGERTAASAYIPYSGTGSAPDYTTTTFTYTVQAADNSAVVGVDVNATIYDLAGNPNYYSSSDANASVTQSLFVSPLYDGILLDGQGPRADISAASDVAVKVLKPGSSGLVAAGSGPHGVGSTLYFEITYDQNIYTNNYSSAADDIRLILQTTSSGSEVAAYLLDEQLNSYNGSSSGLILNSELTFTYALGVNDDANATGYLLDSLRYDDSGFARYGILDAYGNGINDSELMHDISALAISTGEIDTVLPYIDAVSIVDGSGAIIASSPGELYGNGAVITFELNLSEPVSLVESDFSEAENGLRFKIDPDSGDDVYRVAAYTGNQTDQQTFTFTYVVGSTTGATDKGDVYLNDMTLLGDTYDTALNLETNLSYAGPSSGNNDSGHDVDSGAPVVEALSVEYQLPGDFYNPIRVGTEYTLGIGTTVRFSLTFNEAISFDVNSSGAEVPYLELKAVDGASSTPQRIRAALTTDANSTVADGATDVIAFSFVIGAGDSNSSSDNNLSQQSLYNYLEVFSLRHADQVIDSAANALATSGEYAISGDSFELVHPEGVDAEPDELGDTMIFIDSVRPQLTLLALDKNSAETYGFGENLSLTVSFSEAINATALDGASPLSTVAMRLTRTEPSFIDENRTNFAYTFSKQSTTTDAAGSTVVYLLSSASQGTVYDVDGNGGDAGNFVNFAYEGAITGEYNLTGTIRDLAGNYLDPADKNISNIGSQPSPASLTAPAPTAAIDHLAPRPLATSVRLSGISEPSSSETYELGRVFVFTLSFHEEVSLLNHGDALANLQLDLDFDVSSSDRSIALSSIPAGDASKLYFTYTVSDGDQALENGATLSLNGLSKATGYNTLYLVDAHGNSLDPESVNFAFYDVDGNGSVVDVDGDGVYDAADGDEEFDILQPDYDLLIDGISPYWLSISSSSTYTDTSTSPATEVARSTPYALSAGEAITFTLTASEDLKPSEIGMQLLLDLQPENFGDQQTRAVLGAFYGSSTTTDATDDNYSVITFTYSVGSDPADSLGDGIDHLAIMASSVYQSGTGFITADEAGNPILENNFSLVDNFTVFPADEYLSNNQVKFDTTPPIVESVEIDGFLNGSNLAIGGTLVSFTLHFQDDDLDTTSIYANRDDINLTILNLNTGDNNNTSTSASIPYGEVNSGSLTFEGTFAENIDWSGTFTLQIANAGSLIIDNAEAANGMEDELVLGSGDDNLTLTYVVDTSPPRVANLNEVASSVVTPITAAGAGYGPGRQATFLLTFNEELSSISGSAGGEAELRFFIYDDNASLTSGTDARALRGRIARTISGTSELENITDSDGNNRSVARFYYTVSDDLNDSLSNSDNYDGGTIYLNYADTSGDPTANAGNDYFRCFDGANIVGASASGVTDCYMALDARLKDINNNLSTFTLDDSADWLYAFNRNNLASLAPVDITDFVTDPLEIIGYKIGLDPSNPDRAEGYDTTSDDNPSTVPAISQNVAQPYIGASETEQLSGGDIFFVIEPGAEDFRIGGTPSAEDINLTFSVVGADGKDDEYIASYYAHSGDYLTFEFNIAAFTEDYHSNITLHSISQNAEMTYSDASSPVFVLADSSFAPSLELDTWDYVNKTAARAPTKASIPACCSICKSPSCSRSSPTATPTPAIAMSAPRPSAFRSILASAPTLTSAGASRSCSASASPRPWAR